MFLITGLFQLFHVKDELAVIKVVRFNSYA